jgi:PAS domain S-box-containing protein
MNANPDSKTSLMRHSKADLADKILALQQDLPDPGSPVSEPNAVMEAMQAARNKAAAVEALLEDAIDHISDGFVLYNSDDRLVMCNEMFKEMYSFTDEDIQSDTTWMDLHRISTERGTNIWESEPSVPPADRSGKDFERRLSNGHWIDIRQRRTKTGNIVAIHVDVTERRHAEEALQRSQKITNEAVKIAHLGHWTYDVVNRNTSYCSEEYARIYGYTVEEYSLMAAAENFEFLNIHPDDEDRVRQVYEGSLSTQEHWNMEYRIVRTDGSIGHVREIGELVRDDHGQFVETLGTIQDISERVRAEEALNESREQYALAMRSTNEVIYDTDLATGAVSFSSGIREDFGLPEQSSSDEPWSKLIHPDFIDLYHQANGDLIIGKTEHLDHSTRLFS